MIKTNEILKIQHIFFLVIVIQIGIQYPAIFVLQRILWTNTDAVQASNAAGTDLAILDRPHGTSLFT